MRIHPDLLGAKPKWQLPAVLGLLASTIFVSGLLAEGNNRAIATQSNRITNLEVVVLRTNVTAGQLVQSSDLALEVRPIDTVPEGAFTKIEDVAGKRVGVDLRTGSLIAKLSLAALAPIEPVAVPPAPKVVELPPPPKAIVPRPRIMPAREMPPKVEPVKIEPEKNRTGKN